MAHPMRIATITKVTATNILVEVFEMLKQKSNSPKKNVTILLSEPEGSVINESEEELLKWEATYDHISNAHGRLRVIANSSRPKIW